MRRKMKRLMLSFFWGAILLLSVAPLAAQNSVDVLNNGPQPANTTGCAVNPNCIPATWSTTSNAGADITTAISANFVFDSNGGALPTDFPSATSGQICLADTRDLTGTTLFGQIAANCQAAGGVALLLIRDSAVNAPSAIPVFTVSTANGDFLRNTVGFNATTGISNYPIRINVAKATPPSNPTGQHNCPNGQAVPAFVGAGTAKYTPNESLCLPAGAGQAVEPSMTVDSQGTIYVESIRGVPGGLDLWRWNKAADNGPNANGTLPFKYEGQPDCGIFVSTFCTTSGLAPGGGDGDVAVNSADPFNLNIPNLAVVSLAAAEVTGSHSTDRANNSSSFLNAAYVGVASGVNLTNPTLSFTDYKIFSCGAGSTCPSGAGLGNLFPALAVDKFGYLYAVWSDNTTIYYSFSASQGVSWSPAIKVTQNTSQAGKSNVFPWIAADANGHVAIAWYGADQTGNSNTVPLTTNWNVYVAETVDGHATKPGFTLSQATDHVNHIGQISTGGLLGSSDRSLADFFQIAIDPTTHLINIAYADNHAGTSVTYFARQKKATSGISTKGKCAGSSH